MGAMAFFFVATPLYLKGNTYMDGELIFNI